MSTTPTPVEPDSVKAEFDDNGQLTLCCGSAAFERLRDLLAAEVGGLKSLEVGPSEVETVLVVRATAQPPYQPNWVDHATMFGCVTLIGLAVVLFFIGLGTVVKWIAG